MVMVNQTMVPFLNQKVIVILQTITILLSIQKVILFDRHNQLQKKRVPLIQALVPIRIQKMKKRRKYLSESNQRMVHKYQLVSIN